MKKLKYVSVALIIMVLFISCKENEPNAKTSVSLYLKSAEVNEMTYVMLGEGRYALRYYYPNNILIQISIDSVKVINNSRIAVNSYKYLSNGQVEFKIYEININLLNSGEDNGLDLQSVCAKKIPFSDYDYGRQSQEGDNLYDGILKADNYVFAVNMSKGDIKVFDLDTNKTFTVKGAIHVNTLFFKIENKIWQMWMSKITPVGNVFQGMADGKHFLCYTLSL